MASVRQILKALQKVAPPELALPGDKIGLQVGDPDTSVTKALVSLDRSIAVVEVCRDSGSQLLLTHHPIIWQPLSTLTSESNVTVCIRELVHADISLIAAHTNWDCSHGGVNDALAAKLDLQDVTPFGQASSYETLKVVTYCPADAVDKLLEAASDAGAGNIGGYTRCGFASSGEGFFDAPVASAPRVGKAGERNRVAEVRLEMELPTHCQSSVESAVRAVHPYEEPAIDFIVTRKSGVPIGRKGRLPQPLAVGQFQMLLDRALETRSLGWEGRSGPIEWVAVIGGAGDDEWQSALRLGCEALVTGEVKQHNAVEASGTGISIFAAGHYATEQPGIEALAQRMREAVPDVEWNVFVPNPGNGGRPLLG